MPFLIFDYCCGRISLRSASIAIGYLQLVLQILGVIFLILLLAIGSVIVSGAVKNPNVTEAQAKSLGAVTIVMAVILLLATAVSMCFTIILLVGVHKKRRGHVKMYLMATTAYLVTYFLIFLAHSKGSVISNIVELLLLGVNVYFLLVVRSYYHKMSTR